MSTSYCLIIEFSRNEKLQKYIIILSQHTNYLHKWLVPFLTCLLLPCFFFYKIPKYMQAKNRLARLDWHFREWPSMLTKLAGYDQYRLARFHPIRNFLSNEIYHFQGCPIKQAVFLPEQPAPCNQLLIQPLLLVPECYFAWNVEVRVLKF